MAEIFLSYSRMDLAFRDRVVSDLNSEGIDVWIDEEGLTPGDPSWQMAIEQAIEKADCTVVLLSPNAKKSLEVRNEIRYSREQEKRVIPLLIAGDMKTAAPSSLIETQYIDLRTQYGDNFRKLVKALRNLFYGSGTPEKEQTSETPSFLPSNWPSVDTESDDNDLIRDPQSQSFPLPRKVPPLPTDRDRLEKIITAVLTAFRSKDIQSEDLKIGQVTIQQSLKSFFLSLKIPGGLSQDDEQKLIKELVNLGFIGGSFPFVRLGYEQPKTSDSFLKMWDDPESNAEQIADDIIEANLILGLSLEEIK